MTDAHATAAAIKGEPRRGAAATFVDALSNITVSRPDTEDISAIIKNDTKPNIKQAGQVPKDAAIADAETLSTAEDLGLVAEEVPSTPAGITSYPFDPRNPRKTIMRIMSRLFVEMINHRRGMKEPERQIVFNILTSIASLHSITAELNRSLGFTYVLRGVLGELPKAKGPYEFPEPFQKNAAIILARIEEDLAAEQAMEEAQMKTEPLTTPTVQSPKRQRTSRSHTSPTQTQTLVPIPVDEAKMRQTLRGVLIVDGGRRSYKLDPNANPPPRSCNVRGHNGLTVGQWWPLRMCAIRDGAHGSSVGGIAGGEKSGAFSIVVSSKCIVLSMDRVQLIRVLAGYEDLDKDHGDILFYSGSNSHDNVDKSAPVITYATKALRRSMLDRRPIRVLRSGAGTSPFSPSKGLRYDGLYTIVSEELKQNLKKGVYLRFKLVRDAGQPIIDLLRPSSHERAIFDKIKTL